MLFSSDQQVHVVENYKGLRIFLRCDKLVNQAELESDTKVGSPLAGIAPVVNSSPADVRGISGSIKSLNLS